MSDEHEDTTLLQRGMFLSYIHLTDDSQLDLYKPLREIPSEVQMLKEDTDNIS